MKDVSLLHPELQVIVRKFLSECSKAGLKVAITQTWRNRAEQEALYAKGRTAPGSIVTRCKYPQSPHCWGVAFDFCRNDGKGAYYDTDGFFAKVGAIGKRCGLFWGGDFKSFVDKPHLELEKFLPNSSIKTLQAKYSTPKKFKVSWAESEDEEMQKTKVEYRLPNGKTFTDNEAVNLNGSVKGSVRSLLEALGYKVAWNSNKITISK